MATLRLVYQNGHQNDFKGTNEWVRDMLKQIEGKRGQDGFFMVSTEEEPIRIGYNAVKDTFADFD